MPSREDIVAFHDPPVPEGASPWVDGAGPATDIEIVEPDPTWPEAYDDLAGRIRGALGWRAILIQHVGSTSVPDLPAKPVIDIDLVVADPDDEAAYLAALEAAGFELRVREPWWFGHRALRSTAPLCNLHVFGPDSPEVVKHRIFRDWLRGNSADRELYAATKREAAAAATASGEDMMQYNARKEQVVREIYQRAFIAMGLLDG
ncbi:GrpB family protein [Nocardioides humilatus]|uniref:GrpB family protein n=1 Tax=Nocardioides humilatus TaxID=2607660 RepID=A0A5B1LE90_9ACTN|nr:GrpB family protein [Nocardioides humilatus]KAA1418766.1 GrpB family protein [Nocardioides humilatus]